VSAPKGKQDASLSAESGEVKNPRATRLLRHADFERVYKQGRRHFSTHMTVFYLLREGGNGLRVGFTVGRVLGGAVDRNRMKRRLREAVRLQMRSPSAPVDVVINPKKTLLKADFEQLRQEVSRAFDAIQSKMPAK
jgi:ribonuclease P protein component